MVARDEIQGAPPLAGSLEEGLASIFGFDVFRLGQRDVMEAVQRGLNALVVMPTGSGKSLCYQLPACVLEGVTFVISPLIALMKDQVDALVARGIPATFINSSIGRREQQDRLHSMEQGLYKIVYIAPERFRDRAFCDAVARTKVALLAIDEAHCISQWGHDFRPDYLRIAEIRAQLNHPTTVALTATATRQVQRDILAQLNLPEADIFVYGFERPNLFFEVYDARSKGDKLARMGALLSHYSGEASIIYCATRRQVEEVAGELDEAGFAVGLYHGGLSDGERERVQNDFMNGVFPTLVATNAFGMGVDKSDIRVIVHYNIPGSIEAYYQEAGRAGRDGDASHCLLLFNYADRGIHEFFNEQTYPTRPTVERVWTAISKFGLGTHGVGSDRVAQEVNRGGGRGGRGKRVNGWGVESAMRQLQRAGHIEFTGSRDGAPTLTVNSLTRTRDLLVDWEYLDSRRDINEGLLSDVVKLSSGRTCRQLYLLRYFNSRPSFDKGCGNCDICCGMPEYARQQLADSSLRIVVREEIDTVVQKILAGVARAKGRFGAHIVAGSLRGSKSKKVLQARLDRLTTYGIVSYLKQEHIVTLLDTFLRHDLLGRDDHGCISLTDEGKVVMKEPALMSADLRLWLEHTLVQRGVKRRATQARERRTSSESTTTSSSASTSDTYQDTLEQLLEGKTPVQIANARDVSTQTILRHMMVLAERGASFDISSMIKPELLEEVRDAAQGWTYGEALAPVKARIRSRCTYDQLKIHIAQVLMDRDS